MSEKLEDLKTEYKRKKEVLEENDKLLQILLQNNLVQIYINATIKKETLQRELKMLEQKISTKKKIKKK